MWQGTEVWCCCREDVEAGTCSVHSRLLRLEVKSDEGGKVATGCIIKAVEET